MSHLSLVSNAKVQLAKLNILVLDNDAKILNLLRDVLYTLGFKSLYLAKDGYEGLGILREKKVDLIITDWDLQPRSDVSSIPDNAVIISPWGKFPPNNGAGFVRSLRHSPSSPNPFVPVIMLVGSTLPNNIRYARDSGVNEILVKPIVANELVDRIIQIINHPRNFVTSAEYRGPCRRRRNIALQGQSDRRKQDIKIIPFERKSA